MANNRMFLVNRRTGARLMLAKYYPSTGWYMVKSEGDMNDVFDEADFGYLTEEERKAKRAQFLTPGRAGRPYSAAGTVGVEWELEYETTNEPDTLHI